MSKKTYKVSTSRVARLKLKKQFDYIAFDQQEPILAIKWLDGIESSILSLSQFPERCALAPENQGNNANSKPILRHFIYKKSFRIIFTIVKNEVIILTVKHSAKQVVH